jgi:hypothetical protein
MGVAIGIALGGYTATRPGGSQLGGGAVQSEPISHKQCSPKSKKYKKNPKRAERRCRKAFKECQREDRAHCQRQVRPRGR